MKLEACEVRLEFDMLQLHWKVWGMCLVSSATCGFLQTTSRTKTEMVSVEFELHNVFSSSDKMSGHDLVLWFHSNGHFDQHVFRIFEDLRFSTLAIYVEVFRQQSCGQIYRLRICLLYSVKMSILWSFCHASGCFKKRQIFHVFVKLLDHFNIFFETKWCDRLEIVHKYHICIHFVSMVWYLLNFMSLDFEWETAAKNSSFFSSFGVRRMKKSCFCKTRVLKNSSFLVRRTALNSRIRCARPPDQKKP